MASICFIVGHGKSKSGGYDPGATYGDYHEFKIAREIAKYAQEYFNANYSDVADLMNYDGTIYLNDRIKKLKTDKYAFIAELHLNAGKGTGTECYYHHESTKGKKYAEAITEHIAAALGTTNRGAKIKLNKNGADYFGIIRSTKPCAVLIETVFIDNAFDLTRIKTAEGQKKCGEAIAEAVAEVRGLKAKNTAFEIGDTVTFTGNKHYVSSNSSIGVKCKGGTAKITAINKNGKHPYHLVRVKGGGSNVYGWVDASGVKK